MNYLEKIYNKGCKQLDINSFKEIEKLVNTLYEDFLAYIPEGEIFKNTPKYTWNSNLSLKLNLCSLIEYNIGSYICKKIGLSKEYVKAGFDENDEFVICLTGDIIPDTIEYRDNVFTVINMND